MHRQKRRETLECNDASRGKGAGNQTAEERSRERTKDTCCLTRCPDPSISPLLLRCPLSADFPQRVKTTAKTPLVLSEPFLFRCSSFVSLLESESLQLDLVRSLTREEDERREGCSRRASSLSMTSVAHLARAFFGVDGARVSLVALSPYMHADEKGKRKGHLGEDEENGGDRMRRRCSPCGRRIQSL